MVNREELIGTTEYLKLQTRCHITRCGWYPQRKITCSAVSLPIHICNYAISYQEYICILTVRWHVL
jgi:hypothetical protein